MKLHSIPCTRNIAGVIIALAMSCKPAPTSMTKTLPTLYNSIINDYDQLFNFAPTAMLFRNISLIVGFEKKLTQQLQHASLQEDDLLYLHKIQHKVRSFLAFAYDSRCFQIPERLAKDPNLRTAHSRWNPRWQDRLNINKINDKRLCSVFLGKIKDLDAKQIDLANPNTEMWHKIAADKQVSIHDIDNRKLFYPKFWQALVQYLLFDMLASMEKNTALFPFHQTTFVDLCERHIDRTNKGKKQRRVSKDICQKLPVPTKQALPANSFRDLAVLTDAVNKVIDLLNQHLLVLDKLVNSPITQEIEDKCRQECVDEYKHPAFGQGGAAAWPNHTIPCIKKCYDLHRHQHQARVKKPLILPFLKIVNEIDSNNARVVKTFDQYNDLLVDAAQTGILPVLLSKTSQKASGELHLNTVGKFFGLGGINYQQLKHVDKQSVAAAIVEVKGELVARWFELQRFATQKTVAQNKIIYDWMLNNEITVARLIMQDPTHVIAVNSLLLEFGSAPITSKLLRVFKQATMAVDIAFFPLLLIAGVATGGLAVAPLMYMAISVNFV